MKRNVRFIAVGLGENVSESAMNEMSEGKTSNRLRSPTAEVSRRIEKSRTKIIIVIVTQRRPQAHPGCALQQCECFFDKKKEKSRSELSVGHDE